MEPPGGLQGSVEQRPAGRFLMRAILRMLDRHWFAPAALRDLAIARVVLVATQMVLLLAPTPLNASPGSSLIQQFWLAEADPDLYQPQYVLRLLLLPLGWRARPGPVLLATVWGIAVASGFASLVGMFTRVSLLAFAAANTFLIAHSYSYGEFHHTEALLVITLWALPFSPSGAVLSLEGFLVRLRGSAPSKRLHLGQESAAEDPFARWPLRLGQWLLVLSYLSAGVWKLVRGGLTWFNGHTLAYHFAVDGLERGTGIGVWLAGHPGLLPPLSVAVVTFELTFSLAVLVPQIAWAYVAAGTVMHLGIYAVHGPPFFQNVALFVVFIEPLRASLARWRRRKGEPENPDSPRPYLGSTS